MVPGRAGGGWAGVCLAAGTLLPAGAPLAEGGSSSPPGAAVAVPALWGGGCWRGRQWAPTAWGEARGLRVGKGRGEPRVRAAPRACPGLREGERQRAVSDPAGSPPPAGPGSRGRERPAWPPPARPHLSFSSLPVPRRASLPCWAQPEEISLFLSCSCSKEVTNQLLPLRCT